MLDASVIIGRYYCLTSGIDWAKRLKLAVASSHPFGETRLGQNFALTSPTLGGEGGGRVAPLSFQK